MERSQEIADDSIRLAGCDGFVLMNDRDRIDGDMHWLIDRLVAEGTMPPDVGHQTFRLYSGYMNATRTVDGHHLNMARIVPPQD